VGPLTSSTFRGSGKVQDLRDQIKFAPSPAKLAEGKAFLLSFGFSMAEVAVLEATCLSFFFFFCHSLFLTKIAQGLIMYFSEILAGFMLLSSKHVFGLCWKHAVNCRLLCRVVVG